MCVRVSLPYNTYDMKTSFSCPEILRSYKKVHLRQATIVKSVKTQIFLQNKNKGLSRTKLSTP